ncbi:MFS transporter [Paenibacillus sp. VCA1]|uniref:MFS transporter n=1 Tax=Paenibacillus sp. VCA1 TaxID=3039148 RepID=UPI0028718737|nr:MFS transporter [Paenibacillus sp. VCA1]MDR9856392.1 MFS transporter [Paenibacillus sp. VCA1]
METKESRKPDPIRIVAIVTALSLLGDSMLYIALPIFWKEAGLASLWEVGFLLSINRFIRLPANPVVGWLYRRMPLRTGLIVAIILGALTTAGYGVVKGFAGWVLLRCLWGIAWSFFRIGGLAAVVRHSSEHGQGKAMGIYNGLYRTGSLAGMLLGGILAPVFGLQTISVLFGAANLVGIPLLMRASNHGIRQSGAEERDIAGKRPSALPKSRIWMIVISSFFVTMFIQGVFPSTLSTLIQYQFGNPIGLLGVLVSVTALSGLLQSVRWVWEPFLASRIGQWSDGGKGRIPLLIYSLLSAFATYAFLSVHFSFAAWIIIALASMVAATSLTTLMDALAGDVAKSAESMTFLTFYSMVQDVGAALGPTLSYFFIAKEHGFEYLYFGVSGMFLLLALLWIPAYLKQRAAAMH